MQDLSIKGTFLSQVPRKALKSARKIPIHRQTMNDCKVMIAGVEIDNITMDQTLSFIEDLIQKRKV
jgi:hypothetical protein